ncbi:DUF5131 family protein [Entomobacter blattae]|uniref:DUF5131 family protein n=1 Tax=Entomobacter blattae TaxID=2762277 RepID=A0A7H1NP65_9PROT|nr:DUF5131 family protein [Entomobacter blattae]QNT77575.1 hypothetical protein JGUZn3_03180 [Entomobacter blattae]
MSKSKIEWTGSTWNPVVGCSLASRGCTNCYAMKMASRLEAMGVGKYQNLVHKTGKNIVWNGVVREDWEAANTRFPKKGNHRVFFCQLHG